MIEVSVEVGMGDYGSIGWGFHSPGQVGGGIDTTGAKARKGEGSAC